MKKHLSFALPLLLLSACGSSSGDITLNDQLENPLYAEQYYDALTDQMVNLVIQNDPLAQDEQMKDVIEKYRAESLRQATKANEKQAMGKLGGIVSDFGYVRGNGLLVDNMLYIGTEFDTAPGPDLHMYLSNVQDPREVQFPDDTAIDLGTIKSAYGAHSYTLPEGTLTADVRSMVLYDRRLKRVYGFAQLQERD